MIFTAFALWLVSGQGVVLRNDVNDVPASRWRYDQFLIKEQLPATVDCEFNVSHGPAVRVELVSAENLIHLRRAEPHQFIAASGSRQKGRLQHELNTPGIYAVVVFNDDQFRSADVWLKVSLDFPAQLSNTLPPQRKFAVILISICGFLAIVSLSARQLFMALKEPPSIGGSGEDGDLG